MSNDEIRMTNFHFMTARMNVLTSFVRRHSAFVLFPLLSSCSSVSFLAHRSAESVVYALGPREGHSSPLAGSLKPACPALVFGSDGFRLNDTHESAVRRVISDLGSDKKARLLIAGYAPPDLPQDHARALSERRAQAVRQRLIELGLDAAKIQTVGFGNDFSPSGPSSGVVVIYRQ
jgi:hypothetical protein